MRLDLEMTGTMSQGLQVPASSSSILSSSDVVEVILAGLVTGATVEAGVCNAGDGAAWATSRCHNSSLKLSTPHPRGATAGVGEPVVDRAATGTITMAETQPRVAIITTKVARAGAILGLAKVTSTSTSHGTSLKTSTGVSSSIIRAVNSMVLSKEAGKNKAGVRAIMTVAAMIAINAKVSSSKISDHKEEKGVVAEPIVVVITEAVTQSPQTIVAEEEAGEVETKT